MPHHTSLIATIVAGLTLAFVFGSIANRFRLSPLVGYLLAGVLIGPFTPGYVADQALAPQLAEIGVILLMFGVGLHFSLSDLMAVKAIAVPGAVVQIGIATLLGMALAWALGWGIGAGIVFGLALSVASTVVLLRALQERRLVQTERGKIAVGWLIVEDLAMVLALVLLPALSGILGGHAAGPEHVGLPSILIGYIPDTIWGVLGWTLLKVTFFVAFMLVIGRRIIPAVLHYVAHTGQRELFRLAVLAISLGVAFGSAEWFGVSFALGAFFAGMVLAESELSHRAAEDILPLRDAFAVLFFVSVGMLFDPNILLTSPLAVIATVLIIVVGKSIAALAIVLAFRYPMKTALTIAVSLAQIGEFSFILASLGIGLKLLPEAGRDLILAGAILSIIVNPLLFVLLDRMMQRAPALREQDSVPVGPPRPPVAGAVLPRTSLTGHIVLLGYGRVGSLIARSLQEAGRPFIVIEERDSLADRIRADGVEHLVAHADEEVLRAAGIEEAKTLVSAIPNPFEGGDIFETARKLNPKLAIVARAHSDAEVVHLQRYGADFIVQAEREIAREMASYLVGPDGAEAVTPRMEEGESADSRSATGVPGFSTG
jgi:CPA2 family monovalent cation:H+ antiporter-2